MKQKSNFAFLLSYAKNEKYKLYLSAFLSVCSSILMVVPYILIYNIILELLKTDLDYNRIKHLAIYTAILIVVRLILFILCQNRHHILKDYGNGSSGKRECYKPAYCNKSRKKRNKNRHNRSFKIWAHIFSKSNW